MKNQGTTLAVIEAVAADAFGSKSEKRALILRNTDNWLNQLLSEWTVLSGEDSEIEREVNLNTPEEVLHEDQSLAPNVEASEHGGKDHRPTKAKSDGNVGDFDVHIKRTEEELAELRQEKRVSSPPTRDYRDRRTYDEYDPSGYYLRKGYRYREEEPRTTSRKYDGDEQEKRPDVQEPEKERKSTKWSEKTPSRLAFDSAIKFKAKAQKARDTVKEKTREKEIHASSAKSRDRDHRSARMDKQISRRAYVEDDYSNSDSRDTVKEKTREKEIHASSAKSRDQDHRSARMDKQSSRRAYVEDDYSSSDSDSATYVTINRPPSPRPPFDSILRPRPKPEPTRRPTSGREEEKNGEDEEEHKRHGRKETAREYIERSQRPGTPGRTSSSRTYWGPPSDRQSSRREEEEDEEEEYWRSIHGNAKEYIDRSQRPGTSGRTSSSRTYWESAGDRQSR